MSLLSWIFKGKKDQVETTDPIWSQIPSSDTPRYQKFFDKMLLSVDIELNTRWSRGIKVDSDALDSEGEVLASIAAEAHRAGLNSTALQVLLWQYFFADEMLRIVDRTKWAERVRERQDTDYFPSSESMYDLIMKDR